MPNGQDCWAVPLGGATQSGTRRGALASRSRVWRDRGGDERKERMTNPVSGSAYPDADERITREVLARLDELNPCSEHWKILITAGMGFFADAYDLFIIGVAATLITAGWHVAGYQKSLLSSLALLTSAAGAVVFGRLADRLGRKKVYGYEVLVLAAGAIASACAPGIWWLIAFRGILGFGIGGGYPGRAARLWGGRPPPYPRPVGARGLSMPGAGL